MTASDVVSFETRWVCCQLGAREHYAIPRALRLYGLLDELVTDLWATPGSLISLGQNKLRERFHPALATAKVRASNVGALAFDLSSRTRGLRGWNLITKRNDWFQQFTVAQLDRKSKQADRRPCTVFAYSYAARRSFELARRRGWKTVLGQIDPGPAEEKELQKNYGQDSLKRSGWRPAPPKYWDEWRDECDLADQIVVNSDWTRDLLVDEGVAPEKIKVIPLAIDVPPEAKGFERQYPPAFTDKRPLRVLFLGQVGLRKGIGPLLEAIELLKNEPIEFWFVGPVQADLTSEQKLNRRIKWIGRVARNDASRFYRSADVFILPTLSDGFGLTQLEAQCWKLPVIASNRCGRVVRHGENGLILSDISANTIAEILRRLVTMPEELQRMANLSGIADPFTLRTLGSSLASL